MRNLSFRFFSFLILCSILLSCVSEGQKSSDVQVTQEEEIDTFKYWVPDLEHPVERMIGVKEVSSTNLRYNYGSLSFYFRNGLLKSKVKYSTDTITTSYSYNLKGKITSMKNNSESVNAWLPQYFFLYDAFGRLVKETYYSSDDNTEADQIYSRVYNDSSYIETAGFHPSSEVSWKRVGMSVVSVREVNSTNNKFLDSISVCYYDSISKFLKKSRIITKSNVCHMIIQYNGAKEEVRNMRYFDTVSFDNDDKSIPYHRFGDKYGIKWFRTLGEMDESYSYIYDHKNNWTHKIENGDTIEKRTITYY